MKRRAQRKKMVKIYWEWKLGYKTVKNILKEYKLSIYELNLWMRRLDAEFEMENWVAEYV